MPGRTEPHGSSPHLPGTTMLTLALSLALLPFQSTVTRDVNWEIILPFGALPGTVYGWGLQSRKADHATVAISSDRHVLVAYHTDRSDIGAPFNLKQVEAAMFRYNEFTDDWTHVQTELVGGVEHFPLDPLYVQSYGTKCERPDVIAVGDRFFVTCTRIYDRTTRAEEPSISEGTWVTWDALQQRFMVHGGGALGLGFPLDFDNNDHDNNMLTQPTSLFVRECAGVSDVVVLRENLNGVSTVGVAYAHQSDFGDYPAVDNTRRCDLRFVSCTFDGTTITNNVPQVVQASIPFDGVTGAGGSGSSAGLILPDLARGYADGRIVLVYEEQQFVSPTSSDAYGLIRLQGWQYDFVTQALPLLPSYSHTIGSATTPFTRRRPNVSSRPSPGGTVDEFTLAFNKELANGDQDVVYEQWQFSESGGYRVPWPAGEGWFNPPPSPPNMYLINDFRPIPLHGTTIPFSRRCLAERDLGNGTCQILEYAMDTDPENNGNPLVLASGPSLGRPAASYWYQAGAPSPHYAVVTWEGPGVVQTGLKIWIRVRE